MKMGMVSDLTDEIISKFQVKNYPTLAVLKFNYETKTNEVFYFEPELLGDAEQSYQQIKSFLDQYSLKNPRNDLIFHKLAMENNINYVKVDTEGKLLEEKDKANGWSMIFKGNSE